jgi:hypothetical protein
MLFGGERRRGEEEEKERRKRGGEGEEKRRRRGGEGEEMREKGKEEKGSTLRLLVFTMKSLARWGVGASSRGLSTMDLSSGSPGTISQWWNTDMQKACP